MEFQLLVTKMDDRAIERLINLMPTDEIEIVKEPETGLLMMAVKDSFDTEFYMGEVLVTEAEVAYDNKKGYAMIIGDEPERAIAAAMVNVILGSGNLDLIRTINKILLSWKKRADKIAKKQGRLLAKTKVNFGTMRKG